jgi:TonB-linked SusC/RagA family outer membrane protein
MSKKRFLKAIMLFVMVLSLQVAHAQLKTVTGVIKDDKGAPIAGATVKAKGSSEATKTADDGSFSLDVQPTTTSLVISSVGFGDQTVSIDNASAVTLKHKATELEDVTVNTVNIGYGIQKRKDVTGSIASVSGKDIKDLPTQSVAGALEGRVAGVDVTNSSGQPGVQPQITIRGVSSLNQPNPLYIIDGVRQATNSVGDGPDAGNNINPADIASIDILKDASAMAIYGSAAAGGVIIITTKKGLAGKPVINLTTRYGQTKPELYKLLDKNDFIKFQSLYAPTGFYATNTDTDTLPNTDWVKELYRNGVEQNYNLSIAGAAGPAGVAPTVNYYMSGVYNNQKGIFITNSSELYGFKLNSDFKLTDRIKVGETIDAYQRSTDPVGYSIDAGSSLEVPQVNAPFRTVPTMGIYDPYNPGEWAHNPPGFSGISPLAQILTKNRNITSNNVQANVYAEVKLPLSLTFRATLGYTVYNEQGNSYEGPILVDVGGLQSNNLFKDFVSYKNLLNAYTLAHDKSYGNHNLNVLIGYEQYQGIYNAVFSHESNVLPSSFAYLPTSTTVQTIAPGGYDPNPLVESEFGRINYNYSGKYFLSASVRRDADYLKFGPGNQAGIFPAASAGWVMTNESFIKKVIPKINFLKLRGSYGEVGNNNINAYLFTSGYTSGGAQGFYGGATSSGAVLTYAQSNLANNDVKWETIIESNIGIDGEALHSKLFFTVEYYDKETKDLLYNLPLAPSSGFPNYTANVGSVDNKGVDILLGYKDHVSELNYTVTFTGSFNKNKVLNLDGTSGQPIFDGNDNYLDGGGKMPNTSLTYTAPGHPFGQFWGLQTNGIYQVNDPRLANAPKVGTYSPKAGDLVYVDRNHDGQITTADDTTIGNPYPKFTYGVNLNLRWKGFDLAILLHGVMGVDIYNGVKPYTESLYLDGNTTSKVFGASNFGNNGVTSQPNIGTAAAPDPNGNYSQSSSYFVENGSYLKLQNLQLGYTFSNRLLDKVKIRTARLYVMGNNLFTITKYSGLDPEIGSQNLNSNGSGGATSRGIDTPYKYPNVRSYSVGLDFGF